MARRALGFIIAPFLVSACVAAAVPSAKTVHETPQILHDVADVQELGDAPSVDGEQPGAAISAEPPAVPLHAVEDVFEPETPAVQSFTRTIDRAWVEARGASRIDAGFTAATLRAAVTLDNSAWRLDQRGELLAYLRGHIVDRDAKFTDADARIVAQLQAGSGATVDGVLTDETMAVLLAMGFHFSVRKAMPREVKLEFYPGEIEDLDAWNREIAEKVTKNRGGFHEVNAPEGEGTIYVHVGRSIVASYRARGGPPFPLDDDDQDREHVAAPTRPGAYKLATGHPHVTSNWYFGQIPWGAEIRKNEGGYQYRWAGRTRWLWATAHATGALKEPFEAEDFEDLPEVTRDGATYLIWNKNDFGPIAWNLVPSDQYVHTTPHTEAQYTENAETTLGFSHGCIHIDPRERDEMVKQGYLGKNILFVVRRWDEHLLPDEIRRDMIDRTVVAATSDSSSRESKDVCRTETTSGSVACSEEPNQ